MKKRSQGFRILFIGDIFFLLGTNFLAILFPVSNQNYNNYWYSSVGFELIPTTYADDDEDEDKKDHEERKREREDHEDEDKDEDRDREEHKDNKDDDEDDYYYIPPVSPAPTNPTTPTPTNPPSTCRTVYDTVTSASGVKSQVPRQVCDTTTPTSPTAPEKTVSPTPVVPVPEKVTQKPVTPVTPPVTPVPVTPPSNNCRALYETVYDTVTTASGTQKQEPRQVSRQVCDTTTPVISEKVAIPPVPVVPTKPVTPVTQKDSPIIQSIRIQSSDDVASGYISDALLAVTVLPENQNSTETSITPSDVNTLLSDITIQDIPVSPGVQDGGDGVPTSRLIERIVTKDGRIYSIIKNLEDGRYILLDEKNGKGDPHTFQFKADAIGYANASVGVPQTFFERVFQFFASLFSGPSKSPVIVESSIITKTQLLAQADVQTRTMERKILKQKIAEAIVQSEATAQSEIQNTQKPSVVPTASVQKKVVPVIQKPTAQVTPKKAVTPVQKTVPKKSTVNTVTQAS